MYISTAGPTHTYARCSLSAYHVLGAALDPGDIKGSGQSPHLGPWKPSDTVIITADTQGTCLVPGTALVTLYIQVLTVRATLSVDNYYPTLQLRELAQWVDLAFWSTFPHPQSLSSMRTQGMQAAPGVSSL